MRRIEKNKHTLFGTTHVELYRMIKEVAKHSLGEETDRGRKRQSPISKRDADREVDAIACWLRKRARRIERDERRITHRLLRQILGQHGSEMRDPKNGSITVYREVTRRKGVLLKRTIEDDRMCNIAYRGETQPVGLPDIRLVRKVCQLDEPHGYVARAFYKSDESTSGSTTTARSWRSCRRSRAWSGWLGQCARSCS
jgi:hypothetical protein